MKDLRKDILDSVNDNIKDLKTEMNAKFDHVDRKFENVERKFDHVDREFDHVDRKFEAFNAKIDTKSQYLDNKIELVEEKFVKFDFSFKSVCLYSGLFLIVGGSTICFGNLDQGAGSFEENFSLFY